MSMVELVGDCDRSPNGYHYLFVRHDPRCYWCGLPAPADDRTAVEIGSERRYAVSVDTKGKT